MDNILFKAYIESRAKEFDVNPNLLTHCFTGVIQSKTEYEILNPYLHYLSGEIYKGAMEKRDSHNPAALQAAVYLLKMLIRLLTTK